MHVKNCNICCNRDIKFRIPSVAEDNGGEEDPFADVDKLEDFSEPEEDE